MTEGTSQVLLSGQASKVALHVSVSLCEKGIKVVTTNDNAYNQLKRSVAMSNNARARQNLILSKTYDLQTWLVGDELSEAEHLKAPKGAHLIPVSQIPPKKLRPDCIYHSTPAMIAPPSLQNVDSCENTQEHEFGSRILNPDAIWQAAIKHGFQPLNLKNP
uniref:Very-long-chain aldehyde decarbonylase CER1-like C-terminal domain-containing protein n=1 Tax=Kalanchoe fedtschenkoi TaxID=63787 RepID=A0A7N0SWZ0_KALFE